MASEGPGPGRRSFGRLVVTAAQELRAHGYHADADATLDRVLVGHLGGMLDEDDMLWLGQGAYLAGRWAEAWAIFDSLHRLHPEELDYVGWLGVTHARLGEGAAALGIDSALAEFPTSHIQSGRPSRWRARIAAALGDRERAVAWLQLARTEGMRLGFGSSRGGLHQYHGLAAAVAHVLKRSPLCWFAAK